MTKSDNRSSTIIPGIMIANVSKVNKRDVYVILSLSKGDFGKLNLTTKNMKTGHNYYVYIVQCKDGLYYTGVTNDLERRLWEHDTGYNESCFTFKRKPVELKYEEHFHDINNAIAWEKQLKGWSRKKKEALFNRDWDKIKKLAKSNKDVS